MKLAIFLHWHFPLSEYIQEKTGILERGVSVWVGNKDDIKFQVSTQIFE